MSSGKFALQVDSMPQVLMVLHAGGRLSRRFRPEGQAGSAQQASRHEQWQAAADVSISGSGAGAAGRQALPDDDPSLYTHRSDRLASTDWCKLQQLASSIRLCMQELWPVSSSCCSTQSYTYLVI